MMPYDGRNAVILGAGRSGEAAARLILARGGSAVVVDSAWSDIRRKELLRMGAVCCEDHSENLPEGEFDLCVVSPAIPVEHPWLQACSARGIPVISEMQLGAAYWNGRMLAVTGSKGKSSLVKVCTESIERTGRLALTAGNYGVPLSERALVHGELTEAWAVVEVSSFQMEHTTVFSPDAAVILNLQADHLDRHGTMDTYGDLKRKLFSLLQPGALALAPEGFDLKDCVPRGVRCERFGSGETADWRYSGGQTPKVTHWSLEIELSGSWFANPVLGLAAAAGCALLRETGLFKAEIEDGFRQYEPLAHRMQPVLSHDGTLFIDDSKATSLSATAAAVRMCGERPVRLIAGGLLKEKDVKFLKDLLAQCVKKVYIIGSCTDVLHEAWSDVVACERCGTMEKAVWNAVKEAEWGDTVLLSPGTASFDQYAGYAARGDDFQRFVHRFCTEKDVE